MARSDVVAALTFFINDLTILSNLTLRTFVNRPLITIMSENHTENKVDSYGFTEEPTSIMIRLI